MLQGPKGPPGEVIPGTRGAPGLPGLPGLIGIFGEPGARGKLINIECYSRKCLLASMATDFIKMNFKSLNQLTYQRLTLSPSAGF